jgi:hypothetical protein
MYAMNLAVTAFVVIALGIGCQSSDQSSRQARASVLDQLEHQTAWLLLGAIQGENEWATQIHHRPLGPGGSIVPKPGEVFIMTGEIELVILGFKSSGEQRRLESPANKALTLADGTGIRVQRDEQLKIDAVDVEAPAGGLRGVWVRVSPSR